jgi:hypothetical protein
LIRKELENSDNDNPVSTSWFKISTPTVGIPREKASDFLDDEIGLRDEDAPSLLTEKRTRTSTARKALRMIAQRIADNRKMDKESAVSQSHRLESQKLFLLVSLQLGC